MENKRSVVAAMRIGKLTKRDRVVRMNAMRTYCSRDQ
jgi:hypothetical protein